MYRIDADGHVANLFSDGDPSLGVPGTKVPAEWMNAVQEELCAILAAAGVALVKATSNQLAAALGLLARAQTWTAKQNFTAGASCSVEPTATTDVARKYDIDSRFPLPKSQQAAVGQQISASCGNTLATNTAWADVANLSVTIVTTGRPVMLMVQPDGSGNPAIWSANLGGSCLARLTRDGAEIAQCGIQITGGDTILVPLALAFVDAASAGSHNYRVQVQIVAPSTACIFSYAVLAAYEL